MLELGTRRLRLDELRLRALVLRLGLRHIGRRCHAGPIPILRELPALLIGLQRLLEQALLGLRGADREIRLCDGGLQRQPRRREIEATCRGTGLAGAHRARNTPPQVHFPARVQAQRVRVVDAAAARNVLARRVRIGASARAGARAAGRCAQRGKQRGAAAGHRGFRGPYPRYSLCQRLAAGLCFLLQRVERGIAIQRPPPCGHLQAVAREIGARLFPDIRLAAEAAGFLEMVGHVDGRPLKRLLRGATSHQHGHCQQSHGQRSMHSVLS